MRDYEIMLILPVDADESTVSTALDRVAKAIEPAGGKVGNIDRWGRRRFAYEIDHTNEGYYVVAQFNAEPSAQQEIERVLNLADEVIRYTVIQLPPPGSRSSSSVSKAIAQAVGEPEGRGGRGRGSKSAPQASAPAPAETEAVAEAPAEAAPAETPAETEAPAAADDTTTEDQTEASEDSSPVTT